MEAMGWVYFAVGVGILLLVTTAMLICLFVTIPKTEKNAPSDLNLLIAAIGFILAAFVLTGGG